MMWVKLTFGGFGRRFVEALVALIVVLAATSATVAASLMVVEGARNTLSRAIRQDRPIAIAAMSVGLASTIIRFLREPVAATLLEASP